MRILIVSEDIPYANMGGLAKHALNLARALVRAGHEVNVLGGDQQPISVASEEGQFGGRFFGELSGHLAGWKERRLGMFLPPKRTWIARRFADVILRHAPGYDVIHYHGHFPNVACFIPASVNFVQTRHDQGSDCLTNMRFRNGEVCTSPDPAACASCVTAHPNAVQRAVSTMAVTRFRRQVAESFQRHKTVFVSDMLRRNFARTAGPGLWGLTIHNFVDRDKLDRARQSTARVAPAGEVQIFVAGRICPTKGIEPFLRELAPHLAPNMKVTIAGDGQDEARLREEFGGSQVQFLGWCAPAKTIELAAGADIIVVPSVWEEPFGSTILEGLLLGKPTFALARGGTPEMACYAADPSQLRLHPDLKSLVRDLLTMKAPATYPSPPQGLGGADAIARKMLDIYRLPPGHRLGQ